MEGGGGRWREEGERGRGWREGGVEGKMEGGEREGEGRGEGRRGGRGEGKALMCSIMQTYITVLVFTSRDFLSEYISLQRKTPAAQGTHSVHNNHRGAVLSVTLATNPMGCECTSIFT